MQNFGLSGQEAMDIIVSGTQNGLDWTHELGDNISEYSASFALAGYSADDYFQLLQNGADGGAYNLDKINDAINEVTNRLGDGTIERNLALFSSGTQNLFRDWQTGGATQKEVIDSIVLDIQRCTSEQDAMTMSAEAFGTMGEDFGIDFVKNLTSIGSAYEDTGGKADQLVSDTTTSSQELEGAMRKIQDAIAPMGESIASILTSLAPIAEVVAGILATFADLPEPAQMAILAVLGIIAAISQIAPVIAALQAIGLGGILSGLGSLIMGTILPAIGGVLSALAPFLPIIAAVVAAIVGIILVVQNWGAICDWFKEHVGPIIENIKNFFIGLWDKIKEIFDSVKNKIETTLAVIQAVITAVFTVIKDVFTTIWNTIVDIVTTVWDAIKTRIETVLEVIKTVITTVWNAISGVITTVVDGIKNTISTVFNTIKNIIETVFNAISSVVKAVWDTIKGVINSILGGIEGMANGVINGINSVINTLNKLQFKIPDWIPGLGGKNFGFNINTLSKVSLPRLAKGGIVTSSTFAEIGEGKQDEAVLPLTSFYKNLSSIMTNILSTKSQDYSGVTQFNLYLQNDTYLDGKKIAGSLTKRVIKNIGNTKRNTQIARGLFNEI